MWPLLRLNRPNSIIDSNSLHLSTLRPVVIDRFMLGNPVIPERNGIRLPAKTAGMFWQHCMIIQKLQQSIALLCFHAAYFNSKQRIYEYPFLTRYRVRSDYRVFHRGIVRQHLAKTFPPPRLIKRLSEPMAEIMYCCQPGQK